MAAEKGCAAVVAGEGCAAVVTEEGCAAVAAGKGCAAVAGKSSSYLAQGLHCQVAVGILRCAEDAAAAEGLYCSGCSQGAALQLEQPPLLGEIGGDTRQPIG